jgi:hypothetical protein
VESGRGQVEGTRFSGDGRSEMEVGEIPISHLPTSIFGEKEGRPLTPWKWFKESVLKLK